MTPLPETQEGIIRDLGVSKDFHPEREIERRVAFL